MNKQISSKEISIVSEDGESIINGTLTIPGKSRSLVLFAHGSGSSRFSPRNQYVARVLQESGISTLLMDLLTQEEELIDERTRQYRFDILLLAARLIIVTKWAREQSETKEMMIGYFGSSTGAAAALVAGAKEGKAIRAIVSRGGRPDLAGENLYSVSAPTLLIVGGNDYGVIELNQDAFEQLTCKKKLEIIPGATHLFEEPGALEAVAKISTQWFKENFV